MLACRRLVVGVVLAGCGRVGFDALPDALTDAPPGPPSAMRDLCRFPQLTVIRSGITADDNMAAMIPPALAGGCGTSPAVRSVSQNDPGILDPTTGRPLLAPDDLAILGGGDANQRAMAYLVMADTPVFAQSDGTTDRIIERATGTVIAQNLESSYSATHDAALVMLITEPIGGAYALSAMGHGAAGTLAAGFFFETTIAPAIHTDIHRWYLLDWNNGDGIPAPSSGDTFTVVGSGP